MQRAGRSTRTILENLFVEHGDSWGFEISRRTGLVGGSLYPALRRLEEEGILAARWESGLVGGRPPRKYYRLTDYGRDFCMSRIL